MYTNLHTGASRSGYPPPGSWGGNLMTHGRLLRQTLVLLATVAMTIRPAAAQTDTVIVQGTVLDASQAAVPNARATLQNTQTGVTKSAESSNVGLYYFGAVQPGKYVLTVDAPGFKRW